MKTIISGHKNPDIDSIMSAYALAELKRLQGERDVEAVCPGLMPRKAAWLFSNFKTEPPRQRNDVYLRVGDIISRDFVTVPGSRTVFEAVAALRNSGRTTIPVTEKDGKFLGFLSPVNLISELLNIGTSSGGLAGRTALSTTKKISKLLEAECLSGEVNSELKTFDIFVAAMSIEFFERHLLSAKAANPLIIVGDRPEIHLRVLQHGVKFLIITGGCPVEDIVKEIAKSKGTTILRTHYDSATVIRRLKFSTPARNVNLSSDFTPLSPSDMIHDIRHQVMTSQGDQFPVCDADGRLIGMVLKRSLSSAPLYRMILVDHNEMSQSIPGADELPLVEVVDHHRIGIKPTQEPIKYTCAPVGSTCTIVTDMFKYAGITPAKNIAALLLSGIVSDTFMLQSPTTTESDRKNAEWLEEISGVNSEILMKQLMEVDSPLATMSAKDAIESDRKDYEENGWKFALSQIEESNLSIMHRLKDDLLCEMQKTAELDKLDFFGLLVTDAVRGNSEFIFFGSKSVSRALPYKKHEDGIFMMPGVLSRKKQLLPLILSIISEIPKK